MLEEEGSEESESASSKMVHFVTVKGKVIENEFANLVSDRAYHGVWHPLIRLCDTDAEPRWISEAVMHSIELASNFFMRFTRRNNCYPRLLLWLVVDSADIASNMRSRLVADLLSTSRSCPESLDPTTRKIVLVFGDELREAAVSGCLNQDLFKLISRIASLWFTDTQSVC